MDKLMDKQTAKAFLEDDVELKEALKQEQGLKWVDNLRLQEGDVLNVVEGSGVGNRLKVVSVNRQNDSIVTNNIQTGEREVFRGKEVHTALVDGVMEVEGKSLGQVVKEF